MGIQSSFPTVAEQIIGFNNNVVDLLSKMLAWKPADRISAKEALLHPYFHEDRQETEDVRMTDVNSPAKIEIQVDSMKTIRKDLE